MASKKTDISKQVLVPAEVEASIDKGLLSLKGAKGEVKRDFYHPLLIFKKEDQTIIVDGHKKGKRERKIIGTVAAHVRNMVRGVQEGHIYKLKICSGHFPMNVKVTDKQISVNNYLGEKIPRIFEFKPNVSVKMEGEIITVESNEKETAGQTAAEIEKLCKPKGKDKRIFQDGIYIIIKDGKPLR